MKVELTRDEIDILIDWANYAFSEYASPENELELFNKLYKAIN